LIALIMAICWYMEQIKYFYWSRMNY